MLRNRLTRGVVSALARHEERHPERAFQFRSAAWTHLRGLKLFDRRMIEGILEPGDLLSRVTKPDADDAWSLEIIDDAEILAVSRTTFLELLAEVPSSRVASCRSSKSASALCNAAWRPGAEPRIRRDGRRRAITQQDLADLDRQRLKAAGQGRGVSVSLWR